MTTTSSNHRRLQPFAHELSLGRMRCVLRMRGNHLIKLELADAQSGVAWANGKLILNLTVEMGGKVFTAATVDLVDVIKRVVKKRPVFVITLRPCFAGRSAPVCHLELELSGGLDEGFVQVRTRLRNGGRRLLRVMDCSHALSRTLTKEKLLAFPVPFAKMPYSDVKHKPAPVQVRASSGYDTRSDGTILLSRNDGLIVGRRPGDFDSEPRLIRVRRTPGGMAFGVDCEASARSSGTIVKPGAALDLGATWCQSFHGNLRDGLLRYRSFMVENAVVAPKGYSPPINYCMCYDTGARYDRFDYQQLLAGLRHAAELGCTLLYTDQGWEDHFGSGRWDETRLGPLKDFVAVAKAARLQVGVLVGMHADAFIWLKAFWRRNAKGEVACGDRWTYGHWIGICPTSKAWQKDNTRRLREVAKAGVRFFSFDFNDYTEPCHVREHGHSIPLGSWEHALGVATQQRMIKQACPDVLIEAHDWTHAGDCDWPLYALRESHHELWGFEYMWNTFEEFTAGTLQNLYYYNMAYAAPLYLHINLAKDNVHRAAFWYIASTVRHLGLGNYAALTDAQKASARGALAIYKQHRDFFVHGSFDGPDPLTHIHVLEGKGAVLLCFNDQDQARTVSFSVNHNQAGCPDGIRSVTSVYGPKIRSTMRGNRCFIQVRLRACEVAVVRVNP